MAKITDEMKEIIKEQLAYVGTSSKDGIPNVAPKGSMQMVDDETLAFAEGVGKKTLENLRQNPRITVAYVDLEKFKGYQFKGEAEILEEGPLYDRFAEISEKKGRSRPKAVVKIKVEEIYSLAGPEPGERIA
jgi:hypothetical protein